MLSAESGKTQERVGDKGVDGLPLEPVITTIPKRSRDDDDEDGMTGTSVSSGASGLTGDRWEWDCECGDSGE